MVTDVHEKLKIPFLALPWSESNYGTRARNVLASYLSEHDHAGNRLERRRDPSELITEDIMNLLWSHEGRYLPYIRDYSYHGIAVTNSVLRKAGLDPPQVKILPAHKR